MPVIRIDAWIEEVERRLAALEETGNKSKVRLLPCEHSETLYVSIPDTSILTGGIRYAATWCELCGAIRFELGRNAGVWLKPCAVLDMEFDECP